MVGWGLTALSAQTARNFCIFT